MHTQSYRNMTDAQLYNKKRRNRMLMLRKDTKNKRKQYQFELTLNNLLAYCAASVGSLRSTSMSHKSDDDNNKNCIIFSSGDF